MTGVGEPALLVAATADLGAERFARIDALCEAAFGEPFSQIWSNIGPGVHVIVSEGSEPVGHAMVVERELHVDERPLRCGYVENVAAAPQMHGRGIGSVVMRRIAALIDERFEIGALATGSQAFYERLGWETWRGPTSVRMVNGSERTAGNDGQVMILRVAATPSLRGDEPISVGWRPGAIW